MSSSDKIHWHAKASDSNQRIDKVLSSHPEIKSRNKASQLIENGLVTVNGKRVKASLKLNENDYVEVQLPKKPQSNHLVGYEVELDIIHEDEDLLVINKPSGLVVHPSAGHQSDSLVNALIHKGIPLSLGFNEDRPGIVHRIDKDTSGLIVVAKNNEAHRALSEQFQQKSVHRVYWCLVHGKLKNTEQTITSYLIRHPRDRKKFASEKLRADLAPKGKKAITHIRVQEYSSSGVSLVHCQLETGRTHQIRIHLSESGHPILNDPIYSSSGRLKSFKSVALRKAVEETSRLALHAAELGFLHPTSNKNMVFKSSWPTDLKSLAQKLGF